ncbi:MAG TPA: DUF2778 domain-containing protein [Paraburkholderia sp.]|jgi:hypothetical protein|nr:DUF2778 domain-containing protein [Paraburkholderia sp.]
MPVHGKFDVDNEPLSPLTLFGVGTFLAYSGNDVYRNRGGCVGIPNNGPIPAGRYWIVDRPAGGIRSSVQAWARDQYNAAFGTPSHRDEWFALYRDDGRIDDVTWINGVKRENFRLHPAGGRGVSLGCITLASYPDFHWLRTALPGTTTIPARNSGLNAYGWIEAIANGTTCP